MTSAHHSEGARYSGVAIALHWAAAGLIAANFIIAWSAEDLPKAERMELMGTHLALGMAVLALTVARIAWRLARPAPALVATLKGWESGLAKVTHGLLYALMIALPFAGWAMVSAGSGGKPFGFFGLFDVPVLPIGKSAGGLFHELHEIFATAMLVLLALHVIGALKHQLVDRDGTMRRMLPWG